MGVRNGTTGLNKWTIYEGDCRKILEEYIDEESVDCVITSPPYWERRSYAGELGRDGHEAAWEYSNTGNAVPGEIGNRCSYQTYISDLSNVVNLLHKKLKKGKFLFINVSNKHKNKELVDISHDLITIAKDAGFNHWDTIIWLKHNYMPAGKYSELYLSEGWEYVLAFTKGKEFHITPNFYDLIDTNFNKVNYFSSNIGFYGRLIRPLAPHPARFPPALPIYCLSFSTKSNDTVLDPFAGSGTTLIEGLKLGLNVIGCELIPNFCDDIVHEIERIKNNSGNKLAK